ncbi:hypothetical protein EB796_021055 [Bugula neritina]|uniref:Uncharacterized protein n=1 Tax=Bugula neritina TaxID=10212 RepID=A0A7J7J5D7_BUGNE|nr:hypothetical protein EB796_021055 [Bugula neritina]
MPFIHVAADGPSAYNSGQFQSKINLMQKKPGLHQKLRTHQGVCFQLYSRMWTGNRKYGSAWGVILYDNASAEYYLYNLLFVTVCYTQWKAAVGLYID